eukprot:11196657-Lingulodinium_polyedra.AAC.1
MSERIILCSGCGPHSFAQRNVIPIATLSVQGRVHRVCAPLLKRWRQSSLTWARVARRRRATHDVLAAA